MKKACIVCVRTFKVSHETFPCWRRHESPMVTFLSSLIFFLTLNTISLYQKRLVDEPSDLLVAVMRTHTFLLLSPDLKVLSSGSSSSS